MKAKKRKTTSVIKSVSPDDTKSHKINSIIASSAPGGGNRTKRYTIKGIPGSAFSLLVQDENQRVYSFDSRGFNGTPAPLTGIIPPNGVYVATVNTSRAESIETRLIATVKKPETSPSAIAEAEIAAAEAPVAAYDSTVVIKESITSRKVTIVVDGTGLSNYTLDDFATTISPAISAGGGGEFKFKTYLKADAGKVVNYVRAPLFDYKYSTPEERGFVLYDGVAYASNNNAHYYNNDGTQILSDVKIIEADGWEDTSFKIGKLSITAPEGEGKIPSAQEDYATWVSRSILIEGSVSVGSMGKTDLTINLMLHNFIEIVDEA